MNPTQIVYKQQRGGKFKKFLMIYERSKTLTVFSPCVWDADDDEYLLWPDHDVVVDLAPESEICH